MKLLDILCEYVSSVPKLQDSLPLPSGDQIYAHYQAQQQHTDIAIYNNLRFDRLAANMAETQDQADYLGVMAQKINVLSQSMFDKANPQ